MVHPLLRSRLLFTAWTNKRNLISTLLLFAGTCCSTLLSGQTYQDQMRAWYKGRTQSLTAEDGWLNLAGLYWLEEGKNAFGSSEKNRIQFPRGTIPGEAGYFELKDGVVTQHAGDGVTILVDGQDRKNAIIFDSTSGKQPVSAWGKLRWTIIKRSSKIGIRLRNLNSEAVTHFKGIEHYAPDTSWIVRATLIKGTGLNSISITNVLGQVNKVRSPGTLHFSIQGREYTLDALEENDQLFIIFADETNGTATYPSGRFLLAAKPDEEGKTVLDFNQAYNPPCAFSPYATCPLPPRQNSLPIEITAGEKNYGHH